MVQWSEAVRNAQADATETAVGVSPVLKVRTGAAPANVAAADSGTVLLSITLPSDWMAAASGGSKAKAGSWVGVAIDTGTPGHFRIYASDGVTAHIQGTATGPSTSPDGDMTISVDSLSSGQSVEVTAATLTPGNA